MPNQTPLVPPCVRWARKIAPVVTPLLLFAGWIALVAFMTWNHPLLAA